MNKKKVQSSNTGKKKNSKNNGENDEGKVNDDEEKDTNERKFNKEQKKYPLINKTTPINSSKKKTVRVTNDWLFDDSELSLHSFVGRK